VNGVKYVHEILRHKSILEAEIDARRNFVAHIKKVVRFELKRLRDLKS